MFGSQLIPPSIISGLLSLISGKIYSTEDLAERLNVSSELLEVCIHIAGIAKGGSKVGKKIEHLGASNSFIRLCKVLKINKTIFINLLRLTLCDIDSLDLSQVLGAFTFY